MEDQPHLMYHLLTASAYDQSQHWINPYQQQLGGGYPNTTNGLADPPKQLPVAAVAPLVGPTNHPLSPAQQAAALICPQPVKCESVYGDSSSGYNITPLGAAPAGGPSSADSVLQQQQQHLYNPVGAEQQPYSTLNLFAGAGYPATPAALMHSAMLGGGGTTTSSSGDSESEQLKRDKELIMNHPLYPLLFVLFQKCELATCTPREPFREGDQVDQSHLCSAASFDNEDMADFAKQMQTKPPFYVPNPELDSMMLNAIQVLRYHLLELEKVHELCDNFCNKYVNKIKERTQMDINAGEQAPPPPGAQQQQPHPSMHHQQQQMASPMAAGNNSVLEQQHYGTPQQYKQVGMEALQQQQPCSSTPQQQMGGGGYLDLSSAGTPSSSAVSNHSAMAAVGADFEQPQHQYYLQQQFQIEDGGGQHHFEQQREGGKKYRKGKQQQPQNGGGPGSVADHPSPDTTAQTTDSGLSGGGGSRSSTAAMGADAEAVVQHNSNGTAAFTPTPTKNSYNNHSAASQQNSLDEMLDETGEDGFSNCGDSMGEERDSGGSECEQKPHHLAGVHKSGGEKNGLGRKKVPKVFSKEAISKFRAWLFNNITHPYPAEEQKKQLAAETGLTILQVNNWFINARRRIVQPMIDSNNRAGRPVQVFKNRRRKSSGGASPSPAPEGGHSPELLANGIGRSGCGGNSSPEESSAANTTGGSTTANSSSSGSNSLGSAASSLLAASAQQQGSSIQSSPLLAAGAGMAFPSPGAAASVMPSYQANAAAAAAVAAAAVSNPYASFANAAAFPFAGMGGMSTMMSPYALNPMAGGWGGMDALNQAHQGGLD